MEKIMFTWILRNNRLSIFLFALGVAHPLGALSSFDLTPSIWTSGQYGQYSVLEPSKKFQEEQLTLKSDVLNPTSFFITFSPSGKNETDKTAIINTIKFPPPSRVGFTTFDRTASNGNATISYQLYKEPDELTPLRDPSVPLLARNVLFGSLDPRSEKTLILPFYVSVLPNQFVPPGLYQDKVVVGLYMGTIDRINSAELVYEDLWSFTVSVPHTFSMREDNDSSGLIWSRRDLDLQTKKACALTVESNMPLKTEVEWVHGKLMAEDKKKNLDYTLSHTITDGKVVVMATPERLVNGQKSPGFLEDEIWIYIEDY
jgi:hypothetical protein